MKKNIVMFRATYRPVENAFEARIPELDLTVRADTLDDLETALSSAASDRIAREIKETGLFTAPMDAVKLNKGEALLQIPAELSAPEASPL